MFSVIIGNGFDFIHYNSRKQNRVFSKTILDLTHKCQGYMMSVLVYISLNLTLIIRVCHLMLEQVVRCCLEHAASVAKTFLTSDAVVVDIKESEPMLGRKRMPSSADSHFSKKMPPTFQQRRKPIPTSANTLFPKQMPPFHQQRMRSQPTLNPVTNLLHQNPR